MPELHRKFMTYLAARHSAHQDSLEQGLIIDADGLILFDQEPPAPDEDDGKRIAPCGYITL